MAQYEASVPHYSLFLESLHTLVAVCLEKASVDVHTIEKRVKKPDSVRRKLDRYLNHHSEPLGQITDLVGLRIIVNFPDEVDVVCEILTAILNVKKRVDKRSTLKHDQFGYLSIHLIVEVTPDRAKLPDWQDFLGLVAEIQVRSILQHAWAMVSRKLIYTKESEAPTLLRRKLHRLAGLFEMADEDFVDLREEQKRLQADIVDKVSGQDANLPLDLISLTIKFQYSTVKDSALRLAETSGVFIDPESHSECWRRLLATCHRIGIRTTHELALKVSCLAEEEVREFAEHLDYYRPPIYCAPLFTALALIGTTDVDITEEELAEDEWKHGSRILNAKTVARSKL